MSFHSQSPLRLLSCFPVALLVGGLLCPTASSGGEFLPISRPLPQVGVRALDTGDDVRLGTALAGRPAVVLLVETAAAQSDALNQAAAELQRGYGPWFSWVAVLSGDFTAADVEHVRAGSQVRLERLYLDRERALASRLGIARLPALLLIDGDGAVQQVCSADDGTDQLGRTAETLRGIAAGSRRRHAGFEDFRLPRVGGTDLVSFLDVAGRESTIVSFIHSNCLACARQLEVLDYARDRHAGQVSFVAVFLDNAPDTRIRGFVAAAGVTPDFVLRDPELRLARRYAIDAVPAMFVVDADGRIVLSRTGYREEDRDGFYRDLETALNSSALSAMAQGVALGEARRIHQEACAFMREGKPEFALLYQERIREMLPEYPSVHLRIAEAAIAAGNRDVALRSLARYLAAQPQTYDSPQVREMIAGMLDPGP